MKRPLQGRTILVVEDQPLIALDVARALEHAGATVTEASNLTQGLAVVASTGLSGAVLDLGLGDEDSSSLCDCLKQKGVPFLIYSGFSVGDGAYGGAPHLTKPATDEQLVRAVTVLIGAECTTGTAPSGTPQGTRTAD
jgi:DNA-binding response OmpR family regulator